MPNSGVQARSSKPNDSSRRVFRYSAGQWIRQRPESKRLITVIGVILQAFAIYCFWTQSLIVQANLALVFGVALLLYVIGIVLMNAMLTSELVRKTKLEAGQDAARQVQHTLIPANLEALPGYTVETFFKLRPEVGGDYFDVIDLRNHQTLFAVADVSGKGMPAALMAANIQALVRSLAGSGADLLTLTVQLNQHLCRHATAGRFATAVFILLERTTGQLTFVNAGHHAPILSGAGPANALEATGMPIGLFPHAVYTLGKALLPPEGSLLLFTDGLTRSMGGNYPEIRLLQALTAGPGQAMPLLESLVNPSFDEDDVTILLVERRPPAPQAAHSST
jgi:sigma-B regulation protein RsbU (phosphoserine phosphatase)